MLPKSDQSGRRATILFPWQPRLTRYMRIGAGRILRSTNCVAELLTISTHYAIRLAHISENRAYPHPTMASPHLSAYEPWPKNWDTVQPLIFLDFPRLKTTRKQRVIRKKLLFYTLHRIVLCGNMIREPVDMRGGEGERRKLMRQRNSK